MAKQFLRDLVATLRDRQTQGEAQALAQDEQVEELFRRRDQDEDVLQQAYELHNEIKGYGPQAYNDVEDQEEQDIRDWAYFQMEMDTTEDIAPMELYLSWNLPITLTDRIARLRLEIGRFGILAHSKRHQALTEFVTKHQTQTIICFSNDRTDLDAYGAGCTLLSADEDEIGSIHYAKLDQDSIHYQCKSRLAYFDDPTLWDYCAGIDGSDRFYMAFETKEDADGFLAVAQPTLWKDATPDQLKRNHLVRNGYSREEVEEYFK